MASIPFRVRGLNVLFVVFSLFVLGGAAYMMSSGTAILYKSGAASSNSASGKLVKKGNGDFAPCGKNVSFTYGLIGPQVLAAVTGPGYKLDLNPPKPKKSAFPGSPRNPAPTPTPVPTPRGLVCTPLSIQASLAEPYVGQNVIVIGTLQNGVFYATSISGVAPKPTPTSSGGPRPTGAPVPQPK